MAAKTSIPKLLRVICSRCTCTIPRTEAGLEAWMADVLDLAGMPINPTTRFSLAAQVQHLLQNGHRLTKANFVKALHTGLSNQAAFNIMQDIKLAEKAAREDAQAKAAAEAVVPEAQG